MPHEVFSVAGPLVEADPLFGIGLSYRTPSEVAKEIQDIYDDVEARSGSIVDTHTLRIPDCAQEYDSNQVPGRDILYLVAKIPNLE